MTTNRWIENSRKAYATLLSLYPKEHRSDYGASMQQVFTDQCRSAYQQKSALGIILLWLRTLPDLGYTVLLEHITSPRASWGLMEPVPNAPLPWKGVLLVLLPGLVYLVSQIAQLTGEPWYLTVCYRAAFILIVPVLAVWAITRRFPIWGLIPVGLLYRLVQENGYQLIVLHPYVFSSNPLLNVVLTAAKLVQKELLIPVVLFTFAIVLLAWRYTRHQKPSRGFWILIGMYLLVAAIQITNEIRWIIHLVQEYSTVFPPSDMQNMLQKSIAWYLYDFTALLLLIFIGTLFTRRHGFFAILIPMGYILPTIVAGLYDATNPTIPLIIISIAVLAYRCLLSLIAPIWMSRTSSQAGKKRVVLISIAFALSIHTVMQFYPYLLLFPGQSYSIAQLGIDVVLAELKIISAIVLGVVMYQSILPAGDASAHPSVEYPELSTEKV